MRGARGDGLALRTSDCAAMATSKKSMYTYVYMILYICREIRTLSCMCIYGCVIRIHVAYIYIVPRSVHDIHICIYMYIQKHKSTHAKKASLGKSRQVGWQPAILESKLLAAGLRQLGLGT